MHLKLYAVAELTAFHRKIENQVILDRAHSYVNPCDMVLIEIFSIQFLQYSFSLFSFAVLLFIFHFIYS